MFRGNNRFYNINNNPPAPSKINVQINKQDLSDTLEVIPLGAGNEVGRSAIIIRFKGKTVMMDCGIHPGYQGLASLPYFDTIDPASIDLLLVSHFHLDHCGAVPYFLQKVC